MTVLFHALRHGRAMALVISDDQQAVTLAPGRSTPQRCAALLRAAAEAMAIRGRVFTGDLAAHCEGGLCAVQQLAGGWAIAGTDIANIGGMEVQSDGPYVVRDGRILKCQGNDDD